MGAAMPNTLPAHFPPLIPQDVLSYSASLQRALVSVRTAIQLSDEMFVPADDLRKLEARLIPLASCAQRLATAVTAAAFWSSGDPSVPVARETLLHAHP